jgi:hypothetical protein
MHIYIKNLKVLSFLFDQKFFIKLFNEIHFLISMEKVAQGLQDCAVLSRKNLERNRAACSCIPGLSQVNQKNRDEKMQSCIVC